MITERDMVVASGRLAYVDSMGGLLPCRVIAVRGGGTPGEPEPCTSAIRCDVRITADRKGWKRGEVVTDYPSYYIVPRGAVLGLRSRRRLPRILKGYYVQPDKNEGAENV